MYQDTEESTEHFFTSFTDLLVGVIFLFILMLMVFAVNLKPPEKPKPIVVTEGEVRANILREISHRMQQQGLPVTLDLAGGIIRLPEALLFQSGQWELSPKGAEAVAELARVMEQVLPCAAPSVEQCQWQQQGLQIDSVLIEGHTDKQPFTNAQGYGNWELSAFRAITVYKAMVAAVPALESSISNASGQPLLGVSAYADRRPAYPTELDPNRRIDVRFNMRSNTAQIQAAPVAGLGTQPVSLPVPSSVVPVAPVVPVTALAPTPAPVPVRP